MSEYNLKYSQLKEKAGLVKNGPSEGTISRWLQFCHIPRKEQKRGYLYSQESVEKIKLCKKFSAFRLTLKEMNLLFDNYSIANLKTKVEKISPEELAEMIRKAKNKNRR